MSDIDAAVNECEQLIAQEDPFWAAPLLTVCQTYRGYATSINGFLATLREEIENSACNHKGTLVAALDKLLLGESRDWTPDDILRLSEVIWQLPNREARQSAAHRVLCSIYSWRIGNNADAWRDLRDSLGYMSRSDNHERLRTLLREVKSELHSI